MFFLGALVVILCSCHAPKTTEVIIVNEMSYDFTICFHKKQKGYLIKANDEKIVHIGEKPYPELSFPFVSDTITIKLKNEKDLYFVRSQKSECNIFDEYNWTYKTPTNNYTIATYTLTEKVLNGLKGME